MADPTKYVPNYSYSGWQATNPKKPLPADEVDNDFANVSRSVNETIDGLKDVRRSDGKLKNQSVGPDQLSPALSIGFTLRGAWVDGETYSAGDGVVYDNAFYSSRLEHVANVTNAPGNTNYWNFLFSVDDLAVAGALAMPRNLFQGDGVETVFSLTFTPLSGFNLLVSVGGVLQSPSEYGVNGTTLTFLTAPPAGYDVEVRGFATTAALVTPADGTVTRQKLDISLQADIDAVPIDRVNDPAAADVPAGRSTALILGYGQPGDMPATVWRSVAPSGARAVDQIDTPSGGRYQVLDGDIDLRSVGIIPGSGHETNNTVLLQKLIDAQRSIVIPAAEFRFNNKVRLKNGTFIRGATPNGVTWPSLVDGVLANYKNQSRLVFTGAATACFDSDPAQGLYHGALTDFSIMVPDSAQYDRLVNIFGPVSWTFTGLRMENASPVNPGGFYSQQVGSDPTWLNRMFDVEIRLPDASLARALSLDWSDSGVVLCAATGGAGSYYFGPGNFEVLGGIYDRANAAGAGWIVDKLTSSATAIKFVGVNFDINEEYALIITAANSPSGNQFQVIVDDCHFRPDAGGTANILFIDHPSTKMIGPYIGANQHTVTGPTPVVVNYAKWDAYIDAQITPTGAPRTLASQTVGATSGTLGAGATATLRYGRRGRELVGTLSVSTATIGTASGNLTVTMPFAAVPQGGMWHGREGSTGKHVVGMIDGTSMVLYIDGLSTVIANAQFRLSGTLELAG